MPSTDLKELEYAIDEITEVATGLGLDFYPIRPKISTVCRAGVAVNPIRTASK